MKKVSHYNAKSIAKALVIGLIFTACHEQVDPDKQEVNIQDQPYQVQVAYTQAKLKTLAQIVLKAAKNVDFREALYDGVEEKFDGNHNVLFEVIANRKVDGISKMKSRMVTNKGEAELFDKAMNAFKDIDGMDYYPQIFIPYYEEIIKIKTENNTRVMLSDADPTIVIYTGDEAQTVYTGYKLDGLGALQAMPTPVDETYAQTNETWVISLNESLISPCGVAQLIENQSTASARCLGGGGSTSGGGSTGGGGGTASVRSATLVDIKIKCHKESWVAGASEVNIITLFNDGGSSNHLLELYGGGPYRGGRIYKMRRKDVKKEKWKLANFKIANHWDDTYPGSQYQFANYVIFEYDVWPTARRTAKWGSALSKKYRSADDYYDAATVIKFNFTGLFVNNGCIEWTGQYQ